MDRFLGFKTEEILTCLLLVVVGYFIAKMFSRSCGNSFSVGGAYGGSDCGGLYDPNDPTTYCSFRNDASLKYKCNTSPVCNSFTNGLCNGPDSLCCNDPDSPYFGLQKEKCPSMNQPTSLKISGRGRNNVKHFCGDNPQYLSENTDLIISGGDTIRGPPDYGPDGSDIWEGSDRCWSTSIIPPPPTPAPVPVLAPAPAPATLSLDDCDEILTNPNSDISTVCCNDSVGGCKDGVPLNCTPDCYSKYSVFYNQCKDHYKEGTRATDPKKYKQIYNANYVCETSNIFNEMSCRTYDYDKQDLTINNHFIKLMDACNYPPDIADNPPEWLLEPEWLINPANPDAPISELNTCKNRCSEQDAKNFKQWMGDCWYGWATEKWPDELPPTSQESNNIVGRLSQLSDTC